MATNNKSFGNGDRKKVMVMTRRKFMLIFSFAQVHSSETGEGSEVRAIMLKSHIVKFLSPEQGMSSEISQDQGMSLKIYLKIRA